MRYSAVIISKMEDFSLYLLRIHFPCFRATVSVYEISSGIDIDKKPSSMFVNHHLSSPFEFLQSYHLAYLSISF